MKVRRSGARQAIGGHIAVFAGTTERNRAYPVMASSPSAP